MKAATVLTLMSFVVSVSHAHADDHALTATQIAERAARPDALNWMGARARVRMVLTDAPGQSRERSMEIIGREKDGLYQSLVRFLNPADIAGTAFLMLERGKE